MYVDLRTAVDLTCPTLERRVCRAAPKSGPRSTRWSPCCTPPNSLAYASTALHASYGVTATTPLNNPFLAGRALLGVNVR
eukprot:15483429-Alexandrium_andersonii.AAC.1